MMDFSELYIEPRYSDISSRKEIDTSVSVGNVKIDVPVISANMDSVTEAKMAKAIADAGAIGAIHRFFSIPENILEFKFTEGRPCFVSVGVKEDELRRARELVEVGASHLIIDIAHGDSKNMHDMLFQLRNEFPNPNLYIVAGNVATSDGTKKLFELGANAVKVGVGPGQACTTKNVAGVTIPQPYAIQQCSRVRDVYHPSKHIIADGGVKEIGDIAKSLALGADLVMCGRLFAGCPETPQPGTYRGMASFDAMKSHRVTDNLPTPEGRSMSVDDDQPVSEIVKLIKGGLQSSFSYSNARTLSDFKAKAVVGDKKQIVVNK